MNLGRVRVLCAVLALWVNAGWSQMVLDGTLGPAGPLAGPDFQIPATLGRQVGPNLFHSFGQFNVLQGESATFSGPAEVQNILSRVTGGSASLINGSLNSSIEGAHLFLLNPAGVLFGPEAQLNVGGAFTASTASSILLGQDGRFDAVNPAASSLTVAPPSAFGFAQANPAPIRIEGSQLRVGDLRVGAGQADISLVGGDIQMQGGSLFSVDGQINLTSVRSAGQVSASPELGQFESGGQIDLSEGATVHGTGSGRTIVRGGELRVADNSSLTRDSSQTSGGGIDIGLKGSLRVETAGAVGTSADGGAGGDVQIQAGRVTLTGEPDQDGPSRIFTDGFGGERGGDISIRTGRLDIQSGGTVETFGSFAAAGNIQVRAESVRISDAAGAAGQPAPGIQSRGFDGIAGNVNIRTDTFQLLDGGRVATSSTGNGSGSGAGIAVSAQVPTGPAPSGGNVSIVADESILISGNSGITSFSDIDLAGSIRLAANSFIFADHAFLDVSGGGGGANLNVNAPLVFIQGSSLNASGISPGGKISIGACVLSLQRSFLGATAGVFTQANCTPPVWVGNWPSGPPLSWPPDEPQDWPASELGAFLPDIWERPPLARACGLKFDLNSFIVRGRGGVALDPAGWQPSVLLAPPGLDRN